MPELLIVFKRIVEDIIEEPCEETDEYSKQLEVDWFQFWKSEGEDIVNAAWSDKYSEYIIKEGDKKSPIDPEAIPTRDDQDQVDRTVSGWQEVWNIHYAIVHCEIYQTYSAAHYNYYSFYRSFKEELLEEIPSYPEVELLYADDQTEQLESFGLPTSFGGKKNQRHNSKMTPVTPEPESQQNNLRTTKKKNRKLRQMPEIIKKDKSLRVYWFKRFSLFSLFDEGIELDRESWFSVTPEKVAIHMAERLRCHTIIDAFCGSGGNAIQFALTCSNVIAIDIDPNKIKNAKHNAHIYGVTSKIEFIIGDYLQLCGSLKGDVVFLSPPWGGRKYASKKQYDIEESLAPVGASALAQLTRQITDNVAFFLPRNSDPQQIVKLAGIGNRVEIEHNFLDKRLVGLTAIYGDWLIDKKNLND